LDEDAAASSPSGGLVVSGWFVNALVMRDFAVSRPFGATTIFGMGIDELRWLVPVRPGDTLTVERRIVETRPLRSRPGSGLARMQVQVANQMGIAVLTFAETIGMPTRP
jgi:acyl dehydratase